MGLVSCERHDDCVVVYDYYDSCPLCGAIAKIDEQEDRIEELKENIADLETQIEELENNEHN